MALALPHLKNTIPSKLRLHGSKRQPGLHRIVGRPIPPDFNPDEVSWVTDRLGVTDWEGACEAIVEGHHVITVAPEININADDKFDLDPRNGKVNQTLDAITNRIQKILDETDKKVVVHCAMGMERAPLTAVWYLHKKHNKNIQDAYKIVILARPITCYRTEWLEQR